MRDVARQRAKFDRRTPFDRSAASLKRAAEFRFGGLAVLPKVRQILFKIIRGDIAHSVYELHRLTRRDADDMGVKALRQIACDRQQPCVGLSKL
jgi:hypothetical protein